RAGPRRRQGIRRVASLGALGPLTICRLCGRNDHASSTLCRACYSLDRRGAGRPCRARSGFLLRVPKPARARARTQRALVPVLIALWKLRMPSTRTDISSVLTLTARQLARYRRTAGCFLALRGDLSSSPDPKRETNCRV